VDEIVAAAAGGSGEENQPMMFPGMSSIGVRDLFEATEGGVMTPELAEETDCGCQAA